MKRGGGYSAYVNGNFMDVKDLDTVCDNLKEIFDNQAKENAYYHQKLKEATNNVMKDAQLQTMRTESEKIRADLRRGFDITEEQAEKISAWKQRHMTSKHNNTISIENYITKSDISGGSFSYEFVPTALGTFGSCICDLCKNNAFYESRGDIKSYQKLLKEYDAEFNFQEAW